MRHYGPVIGCSRACRMRAPRSSREFAESARPYVKRLVSNVLFSRVLAIALLGATGGAFAADAMPDVAQANAAYRRALEADIRAKSEPPSPVSASLLAAMKIDAVQGCQRVDRSEEHTSELQSQSNLVCRL